MKRMLARLCSRTLQVLPERYRHIVKARVRGVARSGNASRGLLHELPWPSSEAQSGKGSMLEGVSGDQHNPLLAYFEAHRQGRGIWKWRHYFDVYHRHLAKFVGKDV